jgi:putative ABC transport system substrate-binding protein
MPLARRRQLLIASVTVLLAPPGLRAQKVDEKVKRIGVLIAGSNTSRGHLERALVESLREQGYAEGRNLVIERRYADGGGRAQLTVLARELEALKLDAVVTTCTPSTRAMKSESASTAIVMASVSDPVGQGLISSLAKPGGNVTGTSSQAEDILPKMLEYFAAVLPRQARIAVLADKRNPVHARLWEQILKLAPATGLRPTRYEIGSSVEIESAIEAAARESSAGLFVLPDHPIFIDHRNRIVAAAGRHRLPGFFWAREFVEAGGLISYGENLSGGWRRAAGYVSRVVRGTRPEELPVAQPTTFELVINAGAARTLGITIPQSLLLRADLVIE